MTKIRTMKKYEKKELIEIAKYFHSLFKNMGKIYSMEDVERITIQDIVSIIEYKKGGKF